MLVTVELNDFSPSTRKKIAEQTHRENVLDALALDTNVYVRAAVAMNRHSQQYTIDKLKNDSSDLVKQMVAARSKLKF